MCLCAITQSSYCLLSQVDQCHSNAPAVSTPSLTHHPCHATCSASAAVWQWLKPVVPWRATQRPCKVRRACCLQPPVRWRCCSRRWQPLLRLLVQGEVHTVCVCVCVCVYCMCLTVRSCVVQCAYLSAHISTSVYTCLLKYATF